MDLTFPIAHILLFGCDCQAGKLTQKVEDSQRHTQALKKKHSTDSFLVNLDICASLKNCLTTYTRYYTLCQLAIRENKISNVRTIKLKLTS